MKCHLGFLSSYCCFADPGVWDGHWGTNRLYLHLSVTKGPVINFFPVYKVEIINFEKTKTCLVAASVAFNGFQEMLGRWHDTTPTDRHTRHTCNKADSRSLCKGLQQKLRPSPEINGLENKQISLGSELTGMSWTRTVAGEQTVF